MSGNVLLFLVAVGWPVTYVASCRIWPYAPCRSCDGSGRNPGSNRQRWGTCRHCDGRGKRERFGVRFAYRKKN